MNLPGQRHGGRVRRSRTSCAPAPAFRGEAIPGAPFQFRKRYDTVRCRHRVCIPAAHLGALAEVLLFGFVYVVGILIVWRHYIALDTATWYATPSVEGSKLSLAGMWYGYLSLPIFALESARGYFSN